MYKSLFTLLLALSVMSGSSTPNDSLPDWPDGRLEDHAYEPTRIIDKVSVGGYYRFFGWNRTMEKSFKVIPSNQFANTPPYVIGVGDLYRDPPMILMNFGLRPGGGTFIGMDWAFYSNFTGNPGTSPINLNLGINLYGTASTKLGNFGFQIGGINWVNVSDFVFGSFVGYERSSIFERNPWEGPGNSIDRAEFFYDSGSIVRDARFGMQAFKGVLMDGTNLPGGLSFRLLYGKSPLTASLESNTPRYTVGGRLKKEFGQNYLAYNTMNYVVYTDQLALNRGGISLHTLSGMLDNDKFTLTGEAGIGQLYSTTQNEGWGEGGRLRFRTKKEWTRFPLEMEVFRISPQFVNYYGSFLSFNTTIDSEFDAVQNVAGVAGNTFFVGSITDVGQLSNNRQGFTLNAWFDLTKKTKFNIGTMISQEVESSSNSISFGHRLNGTTFSRFITFTNNTGPYQRWTSFFRGVSESVFITDVDENGLPPNPLTYNMLQVQLKQQYNLGELPGYLFYVGSFGSANSDFTLVPIFDESAYLRTHYHEFDAFLSITPWLDLCATVGFERIKANDQTNNIYYLDDNGQVQGANVEYVEGKTFGEYGIAGTQIPGSTYAGAAVPAQGFVNQNSSLIGLGFDIDISEQSGLYIRHRRFRQLDENFTEDDYKGTETTIELRIHF